MINDMMVMADTDEATMDDGDAVGGAVGVLEDEDGLMTMTCKR